MKKTTLIILFTIMTLSGFAQEDWFGFNRYKPTRDNTYWLIHLEKPLVELKGKVFNKSLLLNQQEERGAYWIKKYEDVVRAFN